MRETSRQTAREAMARMRARRGRPAHVTKMIADHNPAEQQRREAMAAARRVADTKPENPAAAAAYREAKRRKRGW